MTRIYLILFLGIASLIPLMLVVPPGRDHVGAVALKGDPNWYMNFRRANKMYYQDRDIFYHHIGDSIGHAKQADIIILGHSMALFGIDWRMLDDFASKYHITIFNMASASDAAGEFSLRIIEKYHIRPSIWLINADDHENSFFKNFVQYSKPGDAGRVMEYRRWQAYRNVISKDLAWRMELLLRRVLPENIAHLIYPFPTVFTYRSVTNGNWYNDEWPNYLTANGDFVNEREPDCHALPEEYDWADAYVKRLAGGDVVLTQIPHTRSCRTRVSEIAAHLNAPFISVGWKNMTSFDGGGHLDQGGARKFTGEMLRQLEKTDAFKKLIASH